MADLTAALATLGLGLDGAQREAIDRFEADLYATNAVMNLTRVPREEFWLRHLVDSVCFHDLIAPKSDVLDIGTGPGFPAWPLALLRPDLQLTALDSSGKMLGFLARHPLENLILVEARAEEWGVRGRFDVVTGRALAPLAIQLELSIRPCKVHGCFLPMRTANDAAEIERLSGALGMVLEGVERRALPSGTEGDPIERWFPIYRKTTLTPKGYPRTWAEIKRKPL